MPQCHAGDPRGKLKAVATRWASGRGGTPQVSTDAATQAASAEIAAIMARRAARQAAAAERDIEVGPDEYEAVSLFMSLGTQWRSHPMTGHRLGIDYSAVASTAQMLGITMTPDLFHDLRMMEGAALVVLLAK